MASEKGTLNDSSKERLSISKLIIEMRLRYLRKLKQCQN